MDSGERRGDENIIGVMVDFLPPDLYLEVLPEQTNIYTMQALVISLIALERAPLFQTRVGPAPIKMRSS